MKKKILLFFSTFVFSIVFAQNKDRVKVSWGGEYFLPKKHLDLGFLGNSTDGYVQIGHAYGQSISFQRFDEEYNIKSEKIVPIQNLPIGYASEKFLEIDGKYYWFFSTRGKEEHLFVQEIDINKGSFVGESKKILSAKKLYGAIISLEYYQYGSDQKWHITTSPDRKSTILVQYALIPKDKSNKLNKEEIGLFVFDKYLNKLWGKEYEMPYAIEQMYNLDYHVDNDGNILLLAIVKEEAEKKDKNVNNEHFEILKWGQGDDQVQIIPFEFSDKFVISAVITVDNNNVPLVAGYYSNEKDYASADGFFVLRVNVEEGKIENVFKGTYEFSSKVIKQFESSWDQKMIDKKSNKGKAEVDFLRFKNLKVDSDGSLIIVGEQCFITLEGVTSDGYSYTHNYGNIYSAKIDSNGELKYIVKIPKAQKATTATSYWVGGMSFKSYVFNKKAYFIFTDSNKNLTNSQTQKPVEHIDEIGGVLMLVSVDENGNTAKSKIFDFKEEKSQIQATSFKEVGSNQLMTRTYGKKDVSKPIVLTFE